MNTTAVLLMMTAFNWNANDSFADAERSAGQTLTYEQQKMQCETALRQLRAALVSKGVRAVCDRDADHKIAEMQGLFDSMEQK